ncbi:MAG: GNAT family N-acetyltransferase [Verrucomicrobia bacterium]|nr:GNAT family N-acetyltransferase [Verrucomicrobiota bacterium]
MRLRSAETGEAAALTAIAFAAKRHWGYPEAWLERWRDALTITAGQLAAHATFVAADEGGAALGFALLRREAGESWIEHLWVAPAAMRRGMGRALFERCEEEARKAGATRLKVEADPNAEAFYSRMGMCTYDRVAAAMDGVERFLPLMEKGL